MKKFLFLVMTVSGFFSAQTTVFFEDFESINDLTGAGWTMYNDTNIPFGTYQADFGSNAWIVAGWGSSEPGNKTASSVSWFTVVNPANRWLITPAIVIPADAFKTTLSFKARSHDNMPFSDGFSLKISETDVTKGAFTKELLNVPNAPNQILSNVDPTNVDISNYRGKTIYLSWVNTFTNGNLLSIDDILVFTTPDLATNETENSKKSFSVYPNPSKDSFKIQMKNGIGKNLRISVSDASGKVVKQFDNQENYDISSLSKGVYLVTVVDGDLKETQKLIKE